MNKNIELRWVWHDLSKGAPPTGSVCVAEMLYQKLQYREKYETADKFGEWKDIYHSGEFV